jgi:hypothetical protein
MKVNHTDKMYKEYQETPKDAVLYQIDTRNSEHFDDSGHIYRFDGFDCPLCSARSYWYMDDDGWIDYFITALGCRSCGTIFVRSASEWFGSPEADDIDSGHQLYTMPYHILPEEYMPLRHKGDSGNIYNRESWQRIAQAVYEYIGRWDSITEKLVQVMYH